MRRITLSRALEHFRPLLASTLLLACSATWADESLLVTTTADGFDGLCDTHCSLRDAVRVANLRAGIDLIVLAPGDYVLSRPAVPDEQGVARDEDDNLNGDLDVDEALTIRGYGERPRILGAGSARLLEVLPGATLSLLRLSLEGGTTADNGGAVENRGYLLLREVRVRNNRAITAPGHLPASEGYRAEGVYWDDNLGRGAIFNRVACWC